MSHNSHHEHLINEVSEMLHPMLHESPQAIYVYLDDEHKICNKKFADMLGYATVDEWVENQYPVDDVEVKDQKKAIAAYTNASQKFKASMITATLKKKNGKKIKTTVILCPFIYEDEVFVLHFISPV